MSINSTPLKLYSFYLSSATWRVRTVLNLKKLQYDIIPINLLKGEHQSNEYQKINPFKTVPSLVSQTGDIICDSNAIIEYLEEIYPENNLYPNDPIQKAKVRAFTQIINSFLQPMQKLSVINRIESELKGDKQIWMNKWLDDGFQSLETIVNQQQQIQQGNYCFGNQVTMADIYLYPQYLGAKQRFHYKFDNFPQIQKIMENLQQIKEFQDASPQNQPDFPIQ